MESQPTEQDSLLLKTAVKGKSKTKEHVHFNEEAEEENRERRQRRRKLTSKPSTVHLFDARTGEYNVKQRGFCFTRLSTDIFHTMVGLPWGVLIPIVLLVYGTVFVVFGLLHWWIGQATECYYAVSSFPEALFFSIQNSLTIVYGYQYPRQPCAIAMILITTQVLLGVAIEAVIFGIVFQRFSRPEVRTRTILFSDKAVIAPRDGQRYFMFRIGDMMQPPLIEVSVMAFAPYRRVTAEGEQVYEFKKLQLRPSETVLLALPVVVLSKVDEDSVFAGIETPEDLQARRIEVIVLVEGTDPQTSDRVQARHAYNYRDIWIDYRFTNIISVEGGDLTTDFTRFHDIEPVNPLTVNTQAFTLPSRG